MDTSDDPVSIGLATFGLKTAGAAFAYKEYAGQKSRKKAAAKDEARNIATAIGPTPKGGTGVEPEDAAARRRRKRRASILTQTWGEPTLGTPGLLGM